MTTRDVDKPRLLPPGGSASGRSPRAAAPRIGLLGFFGVGNFGNDASLEAMVRLIRRDEPAAELVVICGDPTVVTRRFGLPAVPLQPAAPLGRVRRFADRVTAGLPSRIAAWTGALAVVRSLDRVIVPGTGILDDFGTGPQGVPFALLRWCLAARVAGARIAFVSIGAGPIHHPLSRRLMAGAARLAHVRTYRDLPSRDFMRRLGFDVARDGMAPDLAFSLPVPAELASARTAATMSDGAPRVALGVMHYKGWRGAAEDVRVRYLDRMADLAARLLANGCRVQLIQGDDADAEAVAALLDRLADRAGGASEGRVIASSAECLADVLAQVAQADVVVTSRFHNLVAAHTMGCPTISLGYAAKNAALQTEMGLGAFCHDIMDFDADRVVAEVGELVRDRARHEARIRDVVSRYRAALDRQQAQIREALGPHRDTFSDASAMARPG